jgi:hypothetical protein
MDRGQNNNSRANVADMLKDEGIRFLDGGKPSPTPIGDLIPARLNDSVYKPVSPDDPRTIRLVEQIRMAGGLIHPIVCMADNVILSGHRRRVACMALGMESVPVVRLATDSTHRLFPALLVASNEQRDKDAGEQLREAVIRSTSSIDPAKAWRELVRYREEAAAVQIETMELKERKTRRPIPDIKQPMLEAIQRILARLKRHLPLSVRHIHYQLGQHEKPLRNAKKPGSTYTLSQQCYKDTSDLLTRARIEGIIPFEAISDETRPLDLNEYCDNAGQFIDKSLKGFLRNYRRHLTQSQPNYVQIVAEKLTVQGIVSPIARKYCLPCLISRGKAGPDSRLRLLKRFKESGRDKLVILFVTDLDPDGDVVAESYARYLRDEGGDFAITPSQLVPVKVGVTWEQVQRLKLPSGGKPKKTSATYREFVSKYGQNVYELESMHPDVLADELERKIAEVLDMDLFRREIELEKQDAADIEVRRRLFLAMLNRC